MGKHRKARPGAAGDGPPPPVAADNNAEELEQKQPKQGLGAQVEALARLLMDANAPAVGVDLRGRVTVWNRRMEDITGFHGARVVGRPISDFVYGAQRKREVQAVVDGCLRDKRPVLELRVPLLTTTGRNAEVLTNMTPLLAEDGACVGVYGVGQDVTEWAIQEKQYATVMMQANAPIIELDKEGNITVWNSKTASMTGYASVDMVGEPLLPVVDESFRKIVSEKIDQALTGIPGADFELPLVTARGSRVEIVLCLTPRFDTLGAVMGVVAIGQDVTERNTKEMEYRKLIETANAPIFGVDTEGRVVIFNTKAAQISEYSPEEVMGMDLVETLISMDFRSEVAAVFQRAFQGIETANFEFPLVTKTGRKVEILLNATPRYDHTGQLVGVVGIGQDITDRIIQEKEYSRLIDTANAPIFGVDCNFEVIIWNKKAAAITDYTNEDTIGQKIFKFISEDYRDAVGKVLSKAMEGEGTANFDFPLITKHGHRLDILLNATPKYDHFGNISGAVGIGQDITDRRAQEQEYTRLIDTANAPIFGVDANGCVNIWNRKAAETTQYSNEEVLGVNLVENFIPDDFQEAVWTVLSQALEGQETANFEFPLITKDGRRVEILLNATPRYNEKSVIIGVVGIGQDITIRMAQEKETNRLIHSANAPIFGVDQDGLVNIWNTKVAEITQFSSEEVMGRDLVNRFVAEDHRESVGLLLRKALQGEPTGNFDFPLITKTGRRVEILLNATPRYDELGQIFGVTGIGQDITERIAQEQEYIRLIDTANAPIFGVDSEGRVNIWNKKAAEIMQYTTAAVMGEKLVEKYITKDYQEAVSNVLSEALNGVETANFEFPLITKAGRRVEILLNATPRYNEHGAVIGMVGIGQDITDRIAQEQEYMRLIDTANAPIFGVDINGRVNIWNRKAAETTQYMNAEVLGKDLVAEFISEEYKVPVRSVLEKAFEGVETANFEFPLITKAGRRVEILLNATPRYNEQGQVMGMVGIGQDITVRMAQEKEKNRMIHSANAPIFGVDQDGLVNIWNLKVAEVTQFSSEEVMGQDLVNRFVAEDHREEVMSNLQKALKGEPTGNFDFPLITKTGRRVEILLNATPRYDELGRIFGVTGIGQDITERIAQEQEYIRLIDTANAPIFGVDSEGRVNIWNKKAAEIMQYTTAAVMGEKLVEKYITKDYQEAVSNVLSEALNGVETANFEFPLITKAGRRVEILLNATPRYNEHGAVIGMVGIGQDITDRIAQEQEYMRLIDTANAPIFGVDINGHVNIWNRKAAHIMQYTTEDVLGKDLVAEFISKEYKVPVRSVLEKAFEGVETANFEFPLITKAGRRVEILLNATPRYNEHGEVMGMVGIGQDITERIAQEQEHSRMIDTANAPIFGVDINGHVNIWNRKAADIMQYTNEDVLGKDLVAEFISEEYKVPVRSVLEKAFEGVETANFEFPLITKAGRRVEILLNATPRYNERGAVIGMVGIGQDITDRIAQEQEYMRLIDTANAPIFGVDINGHVNIWNRKAAHIMQYTTEDVLGKDLVAEFISKEYKVPVRSVLEKAFEGVETANFEFPLITKAGRRVEILLNATPRYNEHGEVMGMVGIGQDITERIAQEQEYTRLIDTANAPIFGVDINGHVNIWNRKAADIMQYTNENVLGKDLVAEFISNEYKVPVRSVLEKAFEGVETANFEFPLITKAGRRVEILLNATPRYNERGEVMGMVGIGQDITERIAQEQEYSRLIDTANAPIFGVDINGHVNIWNRKAADIMQYTNEDVLGKDLVAEFISEEYKVPVRSVLEKAFEGVETANFEFPLITKAGRRVEILLNATPRYNEHGEVKGMVGIGQDITERIAQEQEYSRLIDTANAPIFGVDINGQVNIWNRKAADIMQYTNEDVLGKDLVAEFISNEYKVPVRSVLEKAFEGVETANFEFPLITKAGRRVEILLNATPRYNERGEVMGMVGIGQDITERIAQEQEYTRLIDTANAPIFGVDANICINIFNRKAQQITNFSYDEVVGKKYVETFISPEHQAIVYDIMSKALEGNETASFEVPVITKTGRKVNILLNATARFDQHGQIVGVVGIGQDITDRIAQEQEYTRLIDSANAPIFGVDVNGCVNIWNKKAAEITQYTPNDVMGENLVEKFITEDYREAVRLVLSKACEGTETANFEFPLMTKAGRRVEILLNATSRFNEIGEVMGVVGIGQDITERIAQEQEYTRLIDTANAPIFGVDINGHVNIWNRKAAEIMQYTTEDVLGKDLVAEFISKEYKVPVRSVLEKAFEGVETANFEFPLITKAGRRVEILLNATPRYNEHGEVMGMVGIGQDITERIAQEQEYTRLIDTANAPIFGVDINGHVNIWNRKAADIMQYTNENVLGKDLVAEFISNEYKVPVRSVLEKAFEGVETANFEFPLITKAGRRVEILLNATPRYNERGEVMGMVGIGQDITERIAQEQEYSRLIDTANAPIFGVDINGHVNIWNRKAADIMQYTNENVLGKDLVAEFISEEYKVPVRSVLEKAFEGVETANFEFPLITKAGRRVEILLNATPRYNERGEVMGMVGIGQDITERIAQEQEYSRLIDTANAPIFGVDINGHVNIWNRKAADIMQYTNENVLGKDLVAEFISNEYKVPVRSVLEKAFEGVETANFEFPLITKAGRRVEILLNATPRYNERGEVMGMVGIGQDITERIAQEQEYSRLIDTANAPIFGVDINGHVNIWNRKAADIMQYTNEDVLGKDLVAEFISEEYKVPVRSVLEKAFEGVETANFEFPLITKAGRRVEILLNATPRYNERGEVMGMVGIGQDITERIAQEQEYSRLIDTANAPIFGVDANMRINIFNRKAQQTTNFSVEEVVGENVDTIISPEFKSMTFDIMCKALQGNETASFELALETKTGRKVNILLNATARFDQHGQIVGVVGIGQDITDRIAQEQEYTRLIDSANAPIFGVDVNGCVNIWNKKAAEITQYTPNDVMGENLVEKFITEDYREAVRLVLSKACEGTETANFEFPLMTKAGRRVEILLNATSRFNEIGEVMGVVGIGQDITERIAQEQEYTRLIDTANAPIFGVDINGHVNIWNRKAAEIMQYTTEDVLGKDLVAEFISKEYKVPVRSVLEKAFEGVETANFEFPLITKAGRRVEILLNATPRYNEHGEVMGMVGIGQDITERIAQEQEYTRLIDTANAPIFGVDINGHVNIWNRKAADIMQYTNENVLGKDLVAEFISNEYKVPVRSVLEKAFEGVETANFEFPLITKAGRRVEILLNATPRYNERGEVMGMVGIGQDITERIAQEQEYSRLIDTANAPIFGVDINGHVNIWNRKAADIMQYTNEDVLGKDLVAEFISEEYKVPVRSVLEKAFEGVETANFEFPLITKAGRRVEILLNATPRYNEHGEVKGMVGIGQDITERIAQEQEYSRLIDTANAPIFGVDANMCVNIWNRKAAQITNYSIEEVMGENLVETFISPEFRPIVAEVLSQALTGVETANFEFPLITRPGTRIEILLNATPRYDSNGSIVGVVGIGQDITDRIAQEHEYFRLIDTANAPIFGIDTNGRINEWNQKIEEITGYHKSSVLGLSLVHTFVTPECRQQVRQLLNQALIGIDVGEMELPMTTKRGVFLLLLVNASSKKDMHGNIRGVIGVGQDYTARKHMEAAKVNFLASFSHELRTPLNGVLGMLELLKEQPLDKSIERYVHMAYVSGSLLLNLINDILDLSKIEAGHLEITTAPFQMHDLLEYSIEIFKFKARERSLKLELKSGDNVPKAVIGDVVRLRQVLLNLLSNAIKFTNEGSITVACSVVNSPDLPPQFRKLLFQVIDTGIGMDAEEKMRLFSLFTKLERTRQNNPTGSGLGLAICKQLAELMDGSIDVDSELGVGSNFFFTVVVRLIDEVDPKHAYYASEDFLDPSLPMPSDGSTRTGENSDNASVRVEIPTQARILVVEDNEFNWEVVKCFLQQDDHLLQWEVNGRDAVKAYSENHAEFDLIFMDCEMPIMDGYTATATIREFEHEFNLPRIPILGLTAYAMSGDRQKCLDCGMDEFMVKPISKLSLRKAIRQWMRIRYLGQQNAALAHIPGAVEHPSSALQNGLKTTVRSPVRIAMAPPGAPTPMPSFENDLEDVTLMDAASTARLAPASRHMQQLDLAQAISNLELDDPMSIGLQSGRATRTATPTTSIFSLGPSVNNNVSRQTSSNDLPDLLRLSRNTSGASTVSPPEQENQTSETSATLPYIKAPFAGVTIPAPSGQRSSLPTNPTIWSHPPFNKKDLPTERPQSWSGLVPKKKVSFHEELGSTHPSRGGHSSSSGSGMPSVLERMETGSSVEDEPPAVTTAGQGESAVSHSIDPMSIEIPEGDPVNFSVGVDQCGGHEELFMTLLEKFATTSEAITLRVVQAHESNDFVTARREAHSLKGSSAYVAALRLSKCAFRVQVAYEHLMAQQASGEGSDTLAAKEIVDDSVKLLTKEQRLLRGYLRRNFEFKSPAGSSQAPTGVQPDNQDKPTGPCCVM
ncbi:histidine kinase A two component receptor [Phytophthora cinnamomi]|uniref:histidine kinase A two component receptor n=1 Tax=Phytophthora cinnamomi TaxID=4785 RepID=UPI003559EE5C|nr:histidine kinase A two component receptor [Phytophthora cinnamomi]